MTSAGRRIDLVRAHVAPSERTTTTTTTTTTTNEMYSASVLAAREDVARLLDDVKCHPILVRLAWHDAGTYDATMTDAAWPMRGGANGSVRFDVELAHGANAGLEKAVKYLRPIKARHPTVSWADLIQLGGATAIERAGGPKIPMRYGRADADACPREGNLPDAEPPFGDGAPDAATHLRNVFYRMGLDDAEIVALSGAHTIGRAFKARSGVTDFGYGAKNGTKFTGCPFMGTKMEGAMAGGCSWTVNWLSFDNEYFRRPADGKDEKDLLWLSTDRVLHTDPGFSPHFMRYAVDQDAFFYDFARAFAKLSEGGAKFVYDVKHYV